MAAIKKLLDPNCILNPYKVLPQSMVPWKQGTWAAWSMYSRLFSLSNTQLRYLRFRVRLPSRSVQDSTAKVVEPPQRDEAMTLRYLIRMKCVLKYASKRWSDVYINGCSNATRCYSETYSKVHKLLANMSVSGIISLCIILLLYIDLQIHNPELTVLRLEKTRKSLAAPCWSSVGMSISGKSYYSRVCVRFYKTVMQPSSLKLMCGKVSWECVCPDWIVGSNDIHCRRIMLGTDQQSGQGKGIGAEFRRGKKI